VECSLAELGWQVRQDGTFDLYESRLLLRNAYPGIDGVSVRPMGVHIRGDGLCHEIEYVLAAGSLQLRLEVVGDVAVMHCTLIGFSEAPESVELIQNSEIPWSTKIYKQGRGMCGGSGIIQLSETPKNESYAMISVMDDDDRGITVWSADQRRFEFRSTLAKSSRVAQCSFTATFSTEGIPLPENRLDLPPVSLRPTCDPAIAMRMAASEIAATTGSRPIRPPSYHWCSWYYLYHNLDMAILDEYLDGLSRMKPPPTLDYFQIDAGYFPSLGDWLLPSQRFPNGLKPAFERIRSAGYRPGVWVGPFMVGNRSQLAKDHPDWLLRDRAGCLLTGWRGYGEPKTWGYRDEETYILDSSHPDAFEYLRTVFRNLRGWGAEMFKTDFMFWGYQPSHHVKRHVPSKTSVEYFRDVLQMIREEIGSETFWLGCIAPFFPFTGYADAMRVGGDVGTSWEGGFGPKSMLIETVGNQHLNQVLWQNDPDVLLIRDFHTELSTKEVTSLALWQAFMGGVVATSDPLPEIGPDRLSLWNFVKPSRGTSIARLPFLTQPSKILVAVRELDSGDEQVLVFNSSDHTMRDVFTLAELDIQGERVGFVVSVSAPDPVNPEPIEKIEVNLEPHDCVLFQLSRPGYS
jgi:alpha-galactosidase